MGGGVSVHFVTSQRVTTTFVISEGFIQESGSLLWTIDKSKFFLKNTAALNMTSVSMLETT